MATLPLAEDLLLLVEQQLLRTCPTAPQWCTAPQISELSYDDQDTYTFTRGRSSMTLRLVTNCEAWFGMSIPAALHARCFPDTVPKTVLKNGIEVLLAKTDDEWFGRHAVV